jgi:DNA-binding transcriptional MerR regulator
MAMKLLRSKDAADFLGLKPVTLRELDRQGFLHPIRDWAGHRRFTEEELSTFKSKMLRGEFSHNENKGD